MYNNGSGIGARYDLGRWVAQWRYEFILTPSCVLPPGRPLVIDRQLDAAEDFRFPAPQSVAKISELCSTMNCTARFLECMSVISLSRLWSRMIVGANTTAKFLGDIWKDCQFLPTPQPSPDVWKNLTKFSRSRLATRARWNIRNSRVSRCFGGSRFTVFWRWAHRSAVSRMPASWSARKYARINSELTG